MKILYRIEFPDGYGLFFKNLWDNEGNIVLSRNVYGCKDFPDLWTRHVQGFKDPERDNLNVKKDGKNYFCAFKSIKHLKYWITKDQFKHLIGLGFRIFIIQATDYQIGKYQILYTKESIKCKIDITNKITYGI